MYHRRLFQLIALVNPAASHRRRHPPPVAAPSTLMRQRLVRAPPVVLQALALPRKHRHARRRNRRRAWSALRKCCNRQRTSGPGSQRLNQPPSDRHGATGNPHARQRLRRILFRSTSIPASRARQCDFLPAQSASARSPPCTPNPSFSTAKVAMHSPYKL